MAGIETSISVDDMLTPRIDDMVSSLTVAIDRFEQLDVASNSVAHIRVNTDGLVELETEVGRAESAFRSLGGVIAGLGIGYMLKEQFSSAVEYASDLTEVQNVVDVAFGNSSKVVDEWAQNTIDSVGLSELSAKQYAGTMGAMLKSSGLAGNAVNDMSMSITELAGDMASFYNLDTDVAFEKIRSGISGETEPLKQLGINMSVANLEAYALSEGINASYSEMTQAQQVMLRYNYLMDQTADMQGDYARTSDSFANQVRNLQQSWTAFTGNLASDVLPVLADGIGLLKDGIDYINNNWGDIGPVVEAAAVSIGIYTLATKGAEFATKGWIIANQILSGTFAISPLGIVLGGVVALTAAVNAFSDESVSLAGVIMGVLYVALGTIYNVSIGLVNGVIGIGVELWNFIASFANFFGNVFNDPVAAIAHLFVDLFDTIVGIVEDAAYIIDYVLGTDMAGSIQGFRDDMQAWVDDTVGEQVEYVAKLSQEDYQIGEHLYLDDLWDDGVYAGNHLFDGNGTKDDGTKDDGDKDKESKKVKIDDFGPFNGMGTDVSDIAGHTAAMADSLDITSQSIKYIRDFASQRAINRYTGTTVNIEMTNNNQVSGEADVDSIARRLVATLQTEINTSMEGVH